MFGLFVGMECDTVLIKVFNPQIKAIVNVRLNGFRKYEGQDLSRFKVLLDTIAKQLAEERKSERQESVVEARSSTPFSLFTI